MAEPKWTPGPWRIEERLLVYAGTKWVASAKMYDIETTLQEAQANAHLIAAAPDLYEACEAALEHLLYLRRMVRGPRVSDKTIELLEAALRKARGEDG